MTRPAPAPPRLRPGTVADADAVAALVQAAYQLWVPRIGGLPGPMREDYRRVLATHDSLVAEGDGGLLGVIVTRSTGDDFVVQNLAVRPDQQGRGLGSILLAAAETAAQGAGHRWVRLYTHQAMVENLAYYRGRGYQPFRPDLATDPQLVHLRKALPLLAPGAVGEPGAEP